MLFFVHCIDKPNSTAIRQKTRPAHLEYIGKFGAKILIAGPTLADDSATSTGSMFVIDLPDAKAAAEFAANDPYAKAGLFATTRIAPFRTVILNPPAT
jgi:uncharacterized protein YciI